MNGSEFKAGDWIVRSDLQGRVRVKYVGQQTLIGDVFMWNGASHEGCWAINASANQDWQPLKDDHCNRQSRFRTYCPKCGFSIGTD